MTDAISPEPRLVSLYGMYVVGWEVRTSNRDEMNAATAKIPALWQRVREKNLLAVIPEPKNPGITIGAYTRYQSNDKGPYSLIVGAEVENIDTVSPGMVGITILGQEYMVFTAAGEMPAAVMEAWRQVWDYFSIERPLKRAYTTDFERYDAARPDEVEVYVAVR